MKLLIPYQWIYAQIFFLWICFFRLKIFIIFCSLDVRSSKTFFKQRRLNSWSLMHKFTPKIFLDPPAKNFLHILNLHPKWCMLTHFWSLFMSCWNRVYPGKATIKYCFFFGQVSLKLTYRKGLDDRHYASSHMLILSCAARASVYITSHPS